MYIGLITWVIGVVSFRSKPLMAQFESALLLLRAGTDSRFRFVEEVGL
jgi:hypothetical protein